MRPRGGIEGARLALRLTSGWVFMRPRQFGPIRRAPCERTSSTRAFCRTAPFRPGFGETRRDDEQALRPGVQGFVGHLEHSGRRNRDHDEVRRTGKIPDRRVGAHAVNRGRLVVDGVDGACEVAPQDRPEDHAADAPRHRATRRRPPPSAGCRSGTSELAEAIRSRSSARSRIAAAPLTGNSTCTLRRTRRPPGAPRSRSRETR